MHLTPQERDKLLTYMVGEVAKSRKSRGLKLNLVEATGLIAAAMMELARDGKSVAEIMSLGNDPVYPKPFWLSPPAYSFGFPCCASLE